MAKPTIPSVAADFNLVLPFLQSRGIVSATPPASLVTNAKKVHRATYSLILWRFRLKNLPDHGRVFIEELASDALQILPQVMLGFSKTAKLLARGIIENTLRHLYFADHPIEFDKANRERKWYLEMKDLFDYAFDHPAFLRSESKFDAISRLRTLYDELSAGIHGRRVQDLEMRIALEKIAYTDEDVKQDVEFITRCAGPTNFLLARFHRKKVMAFSVEDRRIILQTMPPGARQTWNEDFAS